jgi:uncharacterized protein YutE (UPF0331/DUF86 family)
LTDPDLVAKKLSLIETCVADLRRLAHPNSLGHDVVQERFVTHMLQIAIQAALDVAAHIVSDENLGEPRTSAELFGLLRRAGWLEHHWGINRAADGRIRKCTGWTIGWPSSPRSDPECNRRLLVQTYP